MSLNTYFINQSINNFFFSLFQVFEFFFHMEKNILELSPSKKDEWMNEWKSGIIKITKKKGSQERAKDWW
jgi:hypothetical protein